MTARRLPLRLRALLRQSRLVQLALIGGFWWFGTLVAGWSGLPVPGGVIGMVAVLALLLAKGIRPGTIRRGADLLLADMLLFFVPAVMGLLDHREFLGPLGLELLGAILLGTLLVMAGTALAVEAVQRLQVRHER